MTVTLQDNKSLTPITILTTYAPNKGYTATERKQHWGKVEETIQQIPKSHMLIWRTDANGQLSERKPDPQYKHIVGPYTNTNETETGNGQRLCNACKTNNLIPMNKWKRPPLNQQEKIQLKQHIKKGTYEEELKNYKTKNNNMDKHQQQN